MIKDKGYNIQSRCLNIDQRTPRYIFNYGVSNPLFTNNIFVYKCLKGSKLTIPFGDSTPSQPGESFFLMIK